MTRRPEAETHNENPQSVILGASLPRPDAWGKVTGSARYPGDLIKPGMLQMKVLFAGRPHARILSIDASAALALPGVEAVFTAADVPYNAFGLIEADQPVLCSDVVRFEGDKVAVVIANDAETAEAAVKLIKVTYEDLPAVFDPEAALNDTPARVHADRPNLLLHVPIHKGDVAAAFASADVVIEESFSTVWQEHAYLQPEAGISYVDEQGRLVIETAGQWLHEDRRQIAEMLQLPEERVVIRYATIGGAFGGREDMSVQHILALAAWILHQRGEARPIALIWERHESILGHHKRHPYRIHTKWGAMQDGTIIAAETRLVADGGAYASTSVEVLKAATLFASGSYRIPNVKSDGYVVYTNHVPSGAFRGFGAPQAQFAAEVMVNKLAVALKLDPAEIRRRNLYQEGDREPTRNVLPKGVSALPVLERLVEEMGRWGDKKKRRQEDKENSPFAIRNSTIRNSHKRHGIGIAFGLKNLGYSFGFPEQATATVELFGATDVESATVRVGVAEVGQGTHLAMRQIAAYELGLPLAQVTMITDDSSEAPNAGSASASRLTLMAGRAVQDAARSALARWRDEDRPAKATVQYRPPATTKLDPTTGAGIPNYAYGYAAQAVEVTVDQLTGQVEVLKIISVHDVGKAINKQQVEAQIEGALAQAVGYALLENFQVRNGKIMTPYLSTYLVPTVLDMPTDVRPVILEL
ncbi:MAG: xanthine dehydrogenase family protein molybdopterin-binding subunit, partial [Caldilineaceae bacterium]